MPELVTDNDNAAAEQQAVVRPGGVRGKYINNSDLANSGIQIDDSRSQSQTTDQAVHSDFDEAAAALAAENAPVVTEEQQTEEQEEAETTEEQEDQQTDTRYIEDPGEFQPSDYSFDITIYDADGQKPKTVKVTSIEQWEELLEGEPNLGSSLAVNKAFRQAQKMESSLDADRQTWEKAKSEYDEAVKNQEQFDARNTQIFNEMQYLIGRGNLPKLTQEEMNRLDWGDKAVLSAHPNIKPHADLLAFMTSENKTRIKAGLAPLNSALDAYNAMQLDTRRTEDVDRKRQQGENRRLASARVSGASSAPLTSSAPKGISVGRTGLGILR